MLRISNRGINMAESPIRKLSSISNKVKAQGKKVIHLNIGQPDIPPPAEVLEAASNIKIDAIKYGPSDGLPKLKTGIKNYYHRNGIQVDESDILVCSGASEAILFVMNAVTDFGDEILTFEPFYANYIGFAVFEGVNIRTIRANINDDFALPDFDKIEEHISPKTKAILLCNPNNPTGYVYSRQEMEVLRDAALKYNLYLIVDEVYREFFYEEKHSTAENSVLNFPELTEHAIMLDSISKRYSMCGARIGCIVSRNQEVMKTIMKYAQARLCPPAIEQVLATIAYSVDDQYLKNVVAEYKIRRDFLVNRLDKMAGVISSHPMGAFYAMVELPVKDTDEFAKWLLEDFEWNGETLMVAPGSGFYNNPHNGKHQIRIAYVLDIKDLERALIILEEALKVYPDRIDN